MKALIIAAGRGERLRPITDRNPKPLIPILDLRLIERVILSAKEAGIKEFVIVTGYLGGKLRMFLRDGSRYGVKVEYVRSRFWRFGNGFSAYEAHKFFEDKFLILMSDHIFDSDIIKGLLKQELDDDECILCVDTSMENVMDIEDATKVLVEDGRVRNIGKELRDYNGVDMGIFLCSPAIFDCLKRAVDEGNYALSDGVRLLANEGKMKAYCVNGKDTFWMDIDTLENLKAAEKILSSIKVPTIRVEAILEKGEESWRK